MNCCTDCFQSKYLNALIYSNYLIGDCDFCNSKGVYLYNSSELNLFFKSIFDLYEVNHGGNTLTEQIMIDFKGKVFSEKLYNSGNTQNLISEIIKDDFIRYKDILENKVKLRFHNIDLHDNINRTLFLSWEKFSDEIKTKNRFHLKNTLDLEKLKFLFKNFQKEIPKGELFFRARICNDSQGFKIDEMGNPPNYLTKSGRANPRGISYLYLSNDIVTTLYEVRASLYDFVSVGTFKLEDDIKVINLSRHTYDVFRLAELESLEEVLIHSSFIDKLENELSKPRRRNDSELDYLPSQYLSELIKSMGYDGIEFKSSLNPNGINLAIFQPKKFNCIDVGVFDITNLHLDFDKLS